VNVDYLPAAAAAEQWRAAVPDLTDDELAALQHLLGAEPHHLRRMAAVYRAGRADAERGREPSGSLARPAEAAKILREVVEDIDRGVALGPATAGTLTAIATALDAAAAARPPLVAAGPDPGMDAAWCQDLGEYMRLADAAGNAPDPGAESDFAEKATDYAVAVAIGLAARARAGDVPGVRA